MSTESCCGLWGLLWGHHFEARYDETTDYPPGTVEAMQTNINAVLADQTAIAFEPIEAITEGYRGMDMGTKTYIHDTCTRCGKVVNRSVTPDSEFIVQGTRTGRVTTVGDNLSSPPKAEPAPAPAPKPKVIVVQGTPQALQQATAAALQPNPVRAMPGRTK